MRVGGGSYLCALLAGALALLPAPARAQTVTPHLTTDDGLPSRYVTALVQDREGFLWIGTPEGLARYDGRRLHTYPQHAGPGGFPSRGITQLHVGPTGTLWVGASNNEHDATLYRLDRRTETFTEYVVPPPGEQTSAGGVSALLEARDGAVWVGTAQGGLHRLDPSAGSRQAPETGTITLAIVPRSPGTGVSALHEDGQGDLWAAMGPEIARFRRGRPPAWYDAPSGGEVYGFAEHDGRLLVAHGGHAGQANGLARYDPTRDRFEPLDTSWGTTSLWLAQDGDAAWVWLRDGLRRVSLSEPPRQLPPPIWSEWWGSALWAGHDGTLWLGTGRGVYRLLPRGEPFRTLTAEDGLGRPSTNAILTTPDGLLWFATNDGLYRYDRDGARLDRYALPPPGPTQTERIWSLTLDGDGTLLAGTADHGLYRFHAGRFTPVPLPSSIGADGRATEHLRIRHVYREPGGTLWIGADTGLLRRDPETGAFTAYRPDPDDPAALPHEHVNVIRRDRRGRLWLGLDFGLVEWDDVGGRVRRRYGIGDGSGLRNEVIWTIHEAADGALWVGTIGGGLHRFDPASGRFQAFTTADGLPANVVYGILPEPGSAALWLSTTRGLARFDPATGAVEPYTTDDGLVDDDFNLAMAYHTDGETLYFGSARGLTSFRPAEVRHPASSGGVAFTGLSVYDAPRYGLLAEGDTVHLAPDETFFTVAFTAVDFARGARRYRYRLDGYDDRWRYADDDAPEAAYTGVPPGRYRLLVERLDRAARAPVAAASLAVYVAPAWWQRPAVQGLFAALALALAGGAGGWVQRQRTRRALAEAEAERARERAVAHRLATSREAERQQLARELHDGPLQDLYGLGHRLDDLAERDGQATEVGEARRSLTLVADELRRLCAALRPPVLTHFGPAVALRAHAERLGRQPGAPRVTFETAADGRALAEPAQLALYRIGQEALNNAVKHAHAAHVRAALAEGDGGLRLVVEDDGQGFAQPDTWSSLAEADHFGLVGAVERAESVGGRLAVRSAPGEGTRVEAWLPFAPPPAE